MLRNSLLYIRCSAQAIGFRLRSALICRWQKPTARMLCFSPAAPSTRMGILCRTLARRSLFPQTSSARSWRPAVMFVIMFASTARFARCVPVSSPLPFASERRRATSVFTRNLKALSVRRSTSSLTLSKKHNRTKERKEKK